MVMRAGPLGIQLLDPSVPFCMRQLATSPTDSQTMDEFEEAVEMGTLESFLKQDTDHADASMTIGEAELDRLMREMTDADLDQLVGDLTIDDIDPAAVKEAVKEDPVVPKAAAVEEPSKAAAVEPVAPVKAVEPVVAVEESVKLPAAEPEAPVKESAATETQSASTGILGTATAAVTIAATTAVATVSETASSVADAAKSLVAEPEGVTAKRADVVAEDKEEEKEASPVATKTEEKEAAPLTAEASLDDVIDKTLAKEAVEAEQKKEKDE